MIIIMVPEIVHLPVHGEYNKIGPNLIDCCSMAQQW